MVEVQLTADDFVAANFVHARWTPARWIRLGVVFAALLVLGVIVGRDQDDPISRLAPILFAYAPLMLLVLVAGRYWLMPRQARRIYAQTKSLQRVYRWWWNEEQLNYSSDLANAIVPWADLVKWREGEEVFLLYPSNLTFYVFPKRVFANDAAVDAFRQLLQRKIAMPTKPEATF